MYINISYVDNKYFIETNNIYSLWCAKEYLADDIILIEGDVLFDRNILSALVDNIPSNTAVIDDFRSAWGKVAIDWGELPGAKKPPQPQHRPRRLYRISISKACFKATLRSETLLKPASKPL